MLCNDCIHNKVCEWVPNFDDICTDHLTERPQGHWVKDDAWRNGEYIGGYWHINCPCVDGYSSKVKYNFCPNCGAKMKGGED